MTGIRLAAMMTHPHWDGVLSLANPVGDVEVKAAALLRDVGSEIAAEPASLLVLMYSADRDDWRLDRLVSRAHAAEAAAVMIEGLSPLRRSTSALASRLRIPVLGTSHPIGCYWAIETLLTQPQVATATLVLQVLAAGRRAGPSLEEALAAISRALGRPTALVDPHGVTVSGSLGEAADSLSTLLQRENIRTPGTRQLPLPRGGLAVACPVYSAGTTAWLTTVMPGEFPIEATAVESALAAAAGAIEQRLAATRLDLERDARQRTSLLGEILQAHISEASRRRALDLGWELDGWHTGIRIQVGEEVDLTGRRLEVVHALAKEGVTAMVVEHGNGFAAWTTSAREPNAAQVRDQASALRRAQQHLARAIDADMGVGRVHPGPEGIGRSISEASDAARLARGRPESGRFLHVDRLGLAQLLLAWTRTDTFQPAAQALLAAMDGQPGDLVRTLAAYLDSESSVADAAAILGVHRNTVSARVTRIQSLLGVDLTVPDDRLALHLACRTAMVKRPTA
jgi:sugar diacid utilization regulator